MLKEKVKPHQHSLKEDKGVMAEDIVTARCSNQMNNL